MNEVKASSPWPVSFEQMITDYLPEVVPGMAIAPDAKLIDLGLTSLGTIGLLAAIEDAFDIEFPDDLLSPDTFATPATLWAAVAALCAT
jgi:acyl carrier protein